MKSRLPITLIAPLLLVAAVFALYRPALHFDFIWDDNLYVVRNEAVQDWSRAGDAFTSPRKSWSSNPDYNISEWRPLRNISYLVDHSLFGLNPSGWHLHNVLLHSIAAILLFFLLRRLVILFSDVPLSRAAEWCCFLAAAWWALHPVQTEIVAWVKSRDDLLATPLFLGALLLALPAQPHQSRPAIVPFCVAMVLYIAALLSKENAIVLAAVFPLILLYLLISSPNPTPTLKDRLRGPFWTTFALGLISLAYLAMRDIILGRTAQAAHPAPPVQTLLTMLYAFSKYIRLILWPWPPTVQSADYDAFPVVNTWMHPGALSGLAILFALIIIACATIRRVPLVSLGIAIFLIAMLPFANLVPMMQIMAERFLYLPMIGLSIAAIGLLLAAQNSFPIRRFAVGASIAIIIALAWQTHRRLPVWENEISLFNATRQANPISWRPADHYVKSLLKDGQTTVGLYVASENLARWPTDPDIVRTAALAHLLAGNEAAGVALTARAVALQPDDNRATITLLKWRAMQTTE